MEDLSVLVESMKKLQKQLFGAVLSSWLFSTLVSFAEYRNFDVAFVTLLSVVGGIMGTAAILSVYLGRVRHPSNEVSEILDSRVVLQGFAAFVSLVVSAALFYGYYYFAKNSQEICILFLGMGTFLFFRTLASAASTILLREEQKLIWNSMTREQRESWLTRQERLRQLAEDIRRTTQEAKREFEKIKRDIEDNEKEQRKERFRRFFSNIWDKTYSLRKKLGWISPRDEIRELELEQLRKRYTNEFYQESADKIARSEVSPVDLEPSGLQYYIIGAYKFFFVEEALTESRTRGYTEALSALKKAETDKLDHVVVIIPESVQKTHQGIEILKNEGIELFEWSPSSDDQLPSDSDA